MNPAQIHLGITHLPVFGFLLFTPIFLYALWKRKDDVLRISLFMLVVLSISSIVVFNSGEGAEELVENIAGVSEDAIHEHEESGELSFWLFSISGLAAALLLAFGTSPINDKIRKMLFLAGLLFLATSLHSLYTAHLGGQIRHAEELNAVETPNAEEDEED